MKPVVPSGHVARRWGVAVAVLMGLVLVHLLSSALLPFAFAAAIAYVVEPVVGWIKRRLGAPRWLAGLIVFVAIMGLLAAGAFWAQRVIVPELASLVRDAPGLLDRLFTKVFGRRQVDFLGQSMDANTLAQTALGALGSWVGGPAGALMGGFAALMMLFLSLVLLIFFLISGPRIAGGILWLVPPSVRPQARVVAIRMQPVLYRYIGGVIVVVALASLATWVGIGWLLGLPHAPVISLAVGLLETIPVAGPAVSAGLLATVGVASGKLSIIIGVALFALALRLFIDQLIGPLIIGRAVKLHPVVIIFSLLVGGILFGVLGMLLAVPAAATIRIALQIFYDEGSEASPASRAAREEPGAGVAETGRRSNGTS